jgi:CHAD domain-containing protein
MVFRAFFFESSSLGWERDMSDGKWITDLRARTPLANAARHVLTVRLEVVRHYLPLALHDPDKDIEHVHQLRVGTRRAAAALRIFAVCLPDKTYDLARWQLRKVRRAAGEARDWDVFVESLTIWGQQHGAKHQPGLDYLIGHALAHRALAQTHLASAAAHYPFTFDRFIAETVAAVHRPRLPQQRHLVDLARPLLSDLLRDLDQSAARDLNNYENLHQVRIAGKGLRYAMEVFVDCFAEPFRNVVYPAVEEMQEILGNANDSYVAGRRLAELRDRLNTVRPGDWKRYRLGIESLLRHHEQRLPLERKRFLKWWQRWQDAGIEALLAGLLRGTSAVSA